MGQKVHPGGLRVGVIHDWKSNWMVSKKEFAGALLEDLKIRKHIVGKLSHAGLSDILIRKDKQRITIDIYTARPGIVIGKSGVEVDALRKEVHALTQKNVHININEIKRPELDAKLVAQSIAEQLQNSVSFRQGDEALARERDSFGCGRSQGAVLRPSRRFRDEPFRAVLRGPRPAAHDPRRHRLRLHRGANPDGPDRSQGLDQQGRDHARGVRRRSRAEARRPAWVSRMRRVAAAGSAKASAPRVRQAATEARIVKDSARCAVAGRGSAGTVPRARAVRAVPVRHAARPRPTPLRSEMPIRPGRNARRSASRPQPTPAAPSTGASEPQTLAGAVRTRTTRVRTAKPAATEPAATEPAATEPAATEPAATEPADSPTAGDES